VISFQDEATPICGLSQSSSVMPTARSIARAGARWSPSVTSVLRGFLLCEVTPARVGASRARAAAGGATRRFGPERIACCRVVFFSQLPRAAARW
jgi:hypothetical protein